MLSNWNQAYAGSVPKEQWIKEHAHHKDEFDLAAEYDKLVPKAEKAAEHKEKEKKNNQ